jgi:hypothetical protein
MGGAHPTRLLSPNGGGGQSPGARASGLCMRRYAGIIYVPWRGDATSPCEGPGHPAHAHPIAARDRGCTPSAPTWPRAFGVARTAASARNRIHSHNLQCERRRNIHTTPEPRSTASTNPSMTPPLRPPARNLSKKNRPHTNLSKCLSCAPFRQKARSKTGHPSSL